MSLQTNTRAEYATSPAQSVVTLGQFSPDLIERLEKFAALHARDSAHAGTLLIQRTGSLIVDARHAVEARELCATAHATLIVVAPPDDASEALDELDEGVEHVFLGSPEVADLAAILLPDSYETGPLQEPRLAEISARMATMATEIEALLKPRVSSGGLRHVESKAVLDCQPTAAQVRALIRSRRARASYFSQDLFADPTWDILLDLTAAKLEHKQVSVSSLCIAASVPPTTALRWIKTMTEEGLLERTADPADGRRIFIDMTERATSAMQAYLARTANTGSLLAA